MKRLHCALFLSSLLVCLWLGQALTNDQSMAHDISPSHVAVTAPVAEATKLLQEGLEHYQKGDVQGAIAQWQTALRLTAPSSSIRATILTYLVRAARQSGESEQTIAYLEQLIAYYRQTGNRMQVGRMQTEQAQAYSSLGQQRRAIALLCRDESDRNQSNLIANPIDTPCSTDSALAIARHTSDLTGEIAALGSLGNAYRLHGDYDRALQHLQTALSLATQTHRLSHRIAALNGLGNTYSSLAKRDDRRRHYAQQSADTSTAQTLAQAADRYDRTAIAYFEASLTDARAQDDTVNELRSLLNLIVPLWRSEERGERGVVRQEAGGKRQEADGNKQTIGDNKQTIGAKEQTIGAKEQTIGAKEQTIGDNKQTIGDNKQTIGDNKQTIGDNKQTIGDNKQTIGTKEQTIGAKEQTIGAKEQTIGTKEQTIGDNKQTIGAKEQTIGDNKQTSEDNSQRESGQSQLKTQNSKLKTPPPSPLTSSTALQQAQTLLIRLPASREKAYAAIRLSTLTQLVMGSTDVDRDPGTHCLSAAVPLSVVTLLQQAIAIAQQMGDSQSEAFALGRLGHVYECRQQYEPALTLTQQAQFAAANHDSRYLWEWQAGRILRLQQRTSPAIASYELAVQTLQTIRGDLAIASRDFQFDFRDTVEPVYRELTALYLEQATKRPVATQPQQKESSEPIPVLASARTIEKALETIDGLRLAELQNYLGDDCTLTANAQSITVIDQKTAVLSSIMLGDRVAVILTLPAPNHQFRSQVQWLPASTQTVRTTVDNLRRQLEKRSDLANTYETTSRQVYDWLIQPFAQDLQQAQIETLVFIQDGILRSLPMAALYDGKQFLVEQYAIASTLSLTLVDPTHLDRHSLRVLGFGLTQPSVVEGPTFFPSLNYVKAEINSIQTTLPGSKVLLNDAFNVDRLQSELTQNDYPIVHLATHGKFGFDARDTFLVTGGKRGVGSRESGVGSRDGVKERPAANNASHLEPDAHNYNEKLTMNALYRMLRAMRQGKLLELLTLTACETAVGSDRDALGIAGISLQAGARSTVASLWQVDDQATAQLITHFYQSLKQGMSRAKALQVAQKTWLQQHRGDRHHPGYWAALILVGSWL